MSRKSNTEQRRKEITSALLRLLASQGYERASIQNIAHEAHLSPGLIHYHFKNKAEILIELIAELRAVFEARFTALLEKAHSPRERMLAYVNARLAKGSGESPATVAAWVMIGAEAIKQEEVRALYANAISQELKLVEGLIVDYLQERGKRVHSARRVAASILSAMEGSFQLASAAAEHMPQAYAAKTMMALIDRFVELEPANEKKPK